jgi:hypothetical protein
MVINNMKRFYAFILLLMLIMVSTASARPSAPVLLNGDFSSGLTNWTDSSVEGSFTTDSTSGVGGSACVKWSYGGSVPSGEGGILSQNITDLSNDQQGTFSVYATEMYDLSIVVFIKWYAADGSLLAENSSHTDIVSPYKAYSVSHSYSSNDAAIIEVGVQIKGPLGARSPRNGIPTVFIDDAMVSGNAFAEFSTKLTIVVSIIVTGFFIVMVVVLKKKK